MFSAAGPLCFNLYEPYKYQNKSQEKGICFVAIVNAAIRVYSGHHYNRFDV